MTSEQMNLFDATPRALTPEEIGESLAAAAMSNIVSPVLFGESPSDDNRGLHQFSIPDDTHLENYPKPSQSIAEQSKGTKIDDPTLAAKKRTLLQVGAITYRAGQRGEQQQRLEETVRNRKNNWRPHKFDLVKSAAGESIAKTQDRMTAIQSDTRAGFLPTTLTEKELVMQYLDNLDDSQYKLGSKGQILESALFMHGNINEQTRYREGCLKAKGLAEAFGSFYEQSNRQLKQLQQLAELTGDEVASNTDLRMSLVDEIGLIKPFIRYMDLEKFRNTGRISYVINGKKHKPELMPLSSRNGPASAVSEPSPIRFSEDHYTADPPHKEMTKWFNTRVGQLKVGDVREEITDAIADQQHRVDFHGRILQEISQLNPTSEPVEAQKIAHDYLTDQMA
jgi:hypothetical protein